LGKEMAHLLLASASALVPSLARSCAIVAPTASRGAVDMRAAPPLAFELVQGADVIWSVGDPKPPPTCVMVHGILGSRRNLQSFATKLSASFSAWQFLLVDLRCHGQTAAAPPREGDNSVESAARDVIDTLNHLKIYPIMLMGHSFGGKVVMEMVLLSGRVLPRPVQVWVLDTVPGDCWADGVDHPRDTINFVRTLAMPIESRRALVQALTGAGFTREGAQWMGTNLKPLPGGGGLDWTFDLGGIAEMYASYEVTDLWPMLDTQPKGLQVTTK